MSLSMSEWLAMREAADAAARARELLGPVRRALPAGPDRRGPLVIHDLGCGTGAMGRWLAGQLPGPQHWVLYDRDAELLKLAADRAEPAAGDGTAVTVEPRLRELTTLTAADLAGAALVTASALLDMLTRDGMDRIAAACVGAGCPALLALSVEGRVLLDPADPLDAEFEAAFNDHQRRDTGGGRRLLGPDAPEYAVAAFTRLGARVTARPSPWRLGPGHAELIGEWLRGWVGAACEHRPALAGPADGYLRRRLAEAAAGRLRVEVGHCDLFVETAGEPSPARDT
ncbi:MAG TPA: SAM-dependent methyltransferase [Natronosporangium sp.]